MTDPTHPTNRLADEASLYLRQHATNPVDWYPWGEAAFARARDTNSPIFLSIGYSACHWCHVMERESFEDEATAEVLNRDFVAIKVDREERPDIDQIYMGVVQLLSGRGGWPLSLFLYPDGRPITGGTYFPPERRHGMPSFREVLQHVRKAWDEQGDLLERDAEKLLQGLARMESLGATDAARPDPSAAHLATLATRLGDEFDETHGGFGERPKFPNPTYLHGLLLHHAATGDDTSLDRVVATLRAMADGGIYDHLGGGFHRYSVDRRWCVPHFEKMLSDNALLPPLYLEAAQLVGDDGLLDVARETFDYLIREMRAEHDGEHEGYYATQDADSEGEEGRFFVWTPDQVATVLDDPELVSRFCEAYGVSVDGNFEDTGRSVLHRRATDAELAARWALSEADVRRTLEGARLDLFAARRARVAPTRDEKRIAAWNGLAMRAFARGAMVLGDRDLCDEAEGIGRFVERVLVRDDDSEAIGLLRIRAALRDGTAVTRVDGFLEDYAYVAWGSLDTYRASGDPRWLRLAVRLADAMATHFWDPEREAFHVTTESGAEELVRRPVAIHDTATPSAACVAVSVLQQVAILCGRDDLAGIADAALRRYLVLFAREPRTCTSLSEAIWRAITPPASVVIAGEGADADALAEVALRESAPLTDVIRIAALGGDHPVASSHLVGREPVAGVAAAYVCHGATCSLPATDEDALRELLAE